MKRKILSNLLNSKWLLPHLLIFLTILIVIFRGNTVSLKSASLLSSRTYELNLEMSFESDGDIDISTYLPSDTHRQELTNENILAKGMTSEEHLSTHGRFVTWSGGEQSQDITYNATLKLQGISYELSPELTIPSNYPIELKSYLLGSDAIPVTHPEIQALWQKIKPEQANSLQAVLEAIYTYTYQEIKNMPFKGFTDSLTALRLEAASCNGKSRLFTSLARLNNLPTRLIGGVILNGKRKKTSHQWVEVYVSGHWVPFDTINGYFAEIPENYVTLYQGDQNLFRRTSNINFDYRFDSKKDQFARILTLNGSEQTPFIVQLLSKLGLSLTSAMIFLLLPFCSLLIAFLRNIVGLKTFGTFMPMLIAAVCVYTQLLPSLIAFTVILAFAFACHYGLEKIHILKIPRLAAILTLISILTLTLTYYQSDLISTGVGVLALFPAVIITFTADRINDMSAHKDFVGIIKNSLGTLGTILLCYLCFNSVVLQSIFVLYPELLLLVLACLIYIGSWTGVRISELLRFNSLFNKDHQQGVLGINERNRELIYKKNDKRLLRLASDKLSSKVALKKLNIPCTKTLATCESQADLSKFIDAMHNARTFALKPNNGSRGNGILIIKNYRYSNFIDANEKIYNDDTMRKHIIDILVGSFSQTGDEDQAYIEPLVEQHSFLNQLSNNGLADIRIILSQGNAISAMLRVPTIQSSGKANLHQGAIGIAININNGYLERAVVNGKTIENFSESSKPLELQHLPYWLEIIAIAKKCYKAIPLGYMGVDICIDENSGPLVLEVNGRPGLEIQNVQAARLIPREV